MKGHPNGSQIPEEPANPCQLCDRPFPLGQLTRHHCKPRSRGGKVEDIALVCAQCHHTIHALFTNDTLGSLYSTIARLREAPELESFLKWVRNQPPSRRTRPKTRNHRF